MLNNLAYRFFTLAFIATSFLDVSAMADLSLRSFDREPWIAAQSLSILVASLIIPLYLLWRNVTTLSGGKSILPNPNTPGRGWLLWLAMVFVWLGCVLALAWLGSTLALAAGVDSPLAAELRAAYLTGTIKTVAVPIIFAVELLNARVSR
jgi:hypothetical protein